MSSQALQQPTATATDEAAVRALYQQMMDAWNRGSGEAYAAPFAEDGRVRWDALQRTARDRPFSSATL